MDRQSDITVLTCPTTLEMHGEPTVACGVNRQRLNGMAEAQQATIGESNGGFEASIRVAGVSGKSRGGAHREHSQGISVGVGSTSTPSDGAATLSETLPDSAVGIGRACGKVILIGEHVVVYGLPAIAIPLTDLTIEASVSFAAPSAALDAVIGERANCAELRPAGGWPVEPGATDSGLAAVIEGAMRRWDVADELVDVRITSRVPPARGLGFSAACATAAVRGLADLVGARLDDRLLRELVHGGEQIAHGQASGVDAAAVAARTPIRFEAGIARPIVVDHDVALVVADTGSSGSTLRSVELVRAVLQHNWARQRLAQTAAIIESAEASLVNGRLAALGAQLNKFQCVLREFGVSTPAIERLIKAALAAGAFGAKITGGGMGGCVVAVTEPGGASTVRAALAEAGAARTWTVSMRSGAC